MGYYTYPPYPTWSGGVGNFVIAMLEWIIELPLVALANFLYGIAGSATTGSETSITSITGFIGSVWQQSIASFTEFGVLAPILAALIWGAAIVILIFFIFKAFQVGAHEMEGD